MKRSFPVIAFCAHGFWVSTIGRDERTIREYVRQQGEQDRRTDQQLSLPDLR